MELAWDFFKHYLLSRRAGSLIRTVAWLSIAGVGLGVMSLVIVIGIMNGFNDSIRKRMLAVEPHLVARVQGVKSVDTLKNTDVFKKLSADASLQTDVFENQDVIIRTVDGLFGGAVARGVEPKTLLYILRETRKVLAPAGNGDLTPPDVLEESATLGPGEVILGIDLARSLGIFEGDKITLIAPEALLLPPGEAPPFERATVRSLITTNLADIDAKMIYYGQGKSLAAFRASPSREVGMEIRMPNPEDYAPLEAEIEKMGVDADSWVDRNSSLFFALKMEKLAMGVFLSLAALIASFSIITVLVLLLTQKRKDIGLLMSLGLSPRRTRSLFVRVGLILSMIGIGGGLILGIVFCVAINSISIPILPDVYYDATIPATVSPTFVLGILVVATAIAYMSSWFPARSTTRETPSSALRSSRADFTKD